MSVGGVHARFSRIGARASTFKPCGDTFAIATVGPGASIRSLVDWVEWIRKEPDGRRYRLVFVTKPEVTWQQTTMAAIRAFGGEHVSVQNGV